MRGLGGGGSDGCHACDSSLVTEPLGPLAESCCLALLPCDLYREGIKRGEMEQEIRTRVTYTEGRLYNVTNTRVNVLFCLVRS
jgi:hypothetical protein